MSTTELECTPPVAADGPGILSVSMDNMTWQMGYMEGADIMYISLVSVALGRRPYLGEATGHLLLQLDRSIVGRGLTANANWAIPTGEIRGRGAE